MSDEVGTPQDLVVQESEPLSKLIIICSPHSRNSHIANEIRLHLPQIRVLEASNSLDLEELAECNPDVDWIFFPHWSERIPDSVFSSFRCVGFHMTELPFGRGGSPLQNLIMRGYTETIISAFRISEVMDAGDIYLKASLSLKGSAEQILRRASQSILEMILQILELDIQPTPQKGEVVLFSRRRPDESEIKEVRNIKHLYDLIRMVDAKGYPKAFVKFNSTRILFENATLLGNRLQCDLVVESDN